MSVVSFTAGVTVGDRIDSSRGANPRAIRAAMSNEDAMEYYKKLSRQIEIATSRLGAALNDPYLKDPTDSQIFRDELNNF